MKSKTKVYCIQCKYYTYHCSEWGEYQKCKGKTIYTDTPVSRDEDWADPNELNKKNNCKLFEPKPPKVSFWDKIFR